MNKKGSILDLVYIGMILVFFSVVILIGLKIATSFNDNIQANADIDTTTKAQTDSVTAKMTYTMDNTFLYLTILMCIVMLILAAMVAVHPIFIVIYFVTWIFTIFLAGVFSNIYQTMATNSELSTLANDLPFILGIMTYLPLIIGIIGIVLMVVMYKVGNQ